MEIDQIAYSLGKIVQQLESGEKHFCQIDEKLNNISVIVTAFPCQLGCRYQDDCKIKQETRQVESKNKGLWRDNLRLGILLAIFGMFTSGLMALALKLFGV